MKSHLFPRALTLDIRGNASNLVEGSRLRNGYRLRQNGLWDRDILCDLHEKCSGRGEKYAIELIRSLRSKATLRQGGGYLLPNPKPHLLTHFVYSTVWKFVASEHGRDAGLSLGPYEEVLREGVFANGLLDLPFIVGRQTFNLDQNEIPFAIVPHRQKLKNWRTWLFAIGGLQFHLKTDKRPFPAEWEPYIGNGNDPLVLTDATGMDMRTAPILQPIFRRMLNR